MNEKVARILRRLIRDQRDDRQDGYDFVDANGRVRSRGTSLNLGHVSPEEMQVLVDELGMKLDPIVPNGSCETCVHADNGRPGGWAVPCVRCSHPKCTEFVPLANLTKKLLTLKPLEERMLQLALRTYINRPDMGCSLVEFDRTEKSLENRNMLKKSLGRNYVTNKGRLALKHATEK